MIGHIRAATVVRTLAPRGARLAAISAAVAGVLSCAGNRASYTIRLLNRDTVALDSACVRGGEVEARFGTVPPGGEASARVVLRRDVVLRLSALRGERPVRYFLGGFVSRGPDAEVVLTVTPGPALQVGAATPR